MKVSNIYDKKSSLTIIQDVAIRIDYLKNDYSQEDLFHAIIKNLKSPIDKRAVSKFQKSWKIIIADVYNGEIKSLARYKREIPASRLDHYLYGAYNSLKHLNELKKRK
jgi:hypothetical protein